MITFKGKVVQGAKRGKDLGFPTANIALHKKIEEGIYVAKVKIDGNVHNALTFIGSATTFGEKDYKAESFILDFKENLYGKIITVHLLKKIRDNKKFDSPEELVQQINEDVIVARKFFAPWC